MFAVPGWSVAASNLKAQEAKAPADSKRKETSLEQSRHVNGDSKQPKRKRGFERPESVKITKNNFAELWETVIEGKKRPTANGKNPAAAKRKQNSPKAGREIGSLGPDPHEGETQSLRITPTDPVKRSKGQAQGHKKENAKDQEIERTSRSKDAPPHAQTVSPPLPPLPPIIKPSSTNLTPLQASMRQKLTSARFRHLNQTLYTVPSAQSMQLFTENPEMYAEYHEGFRKQVEVWPENPVEAYIGDIKQRGKPLPANPYHKHKRGKKVGKEDSKPNTMEGDNSGHGSPAPPLPRTKGTCTIADLGCGDALLARSLVPHSKVLKLRVLSYDLSAGVKESLVTRADISSLPLDDSAVDVAILCLALMGTNWLDFIDEAFRVLRWKGELWVGEIKSRFQRAGNRRKNGADSNGNGAGTSKKKPKSGKGGKLIDDDRQDNLNDENLLAEIDGDMPSISGNPNNFKPPDGIDTTDVSAFVEVLQTRGFVLQGQADTSNKMFGKMRFLKGISPVRGKNVASVRSEAARPGASTAARTSKPSTWQTKKRKFLDDKDGAGGVAGAAEDEDAKVLKPCVYKLR
ncbi:MAG: 25S rRNA (adenine645-N1)-methyltransferase [Sclerophora amabilis]|nr:MAG: 25S rRNA (adenine645-N1)-methyltransferase [Sclerophora amabilis]